MFRRHLRHRQGAIQQDLKLTGMLLNYKSISYYITLQHYITTLQHYTTTLQHYITTLQH
jgi:hypothetical protein